MLLVTAGAAVRSAGGATGEEAQVADDVAAEELQPRYRFGCLLFDVLFIVLFLRLLLGLNRDESLMLRMASG